MDDTIFRFLDEETKNIYLSERQSFVDLIPESKRPNDIFSIIEKTDQTLAALALVKKVLTDRDYDDIHDGKAYHIYSKLGYLYMLTGRFFDALTIYWTMYLEICRIQEKNESRIHKGFPLCKMYDVYKHLGFQVHAKRFIMLTLCEDAISNEGIINADNTGSYFRLSIHESITKDQITKYASDFWAIAKNDIHHFKQPECLLSEVDKNWMNDFPSINESNYFKINPYYCNSLLRVLPERSGQSLERLAEYLINSVPGFRAERRIQSIPTEYDLMCSVEGLHIDFRSEIGRYFICECKDWKKPVDFSTIAKFSRILDSVKGKFGIIFTTSGISGKRVNRAAIHELLKIYQDRGVVIITIDKNDLDSICKGENFISLIRNRYEQLRFDLVERLK